MKNLIILSMFLFCAVPHLTQAQESVTKTLKKEGLDIGLILAQPPEIIAEEKQKLLTVSALTTIPSESPVYRVASNAHYCAFSSQAGKVTVYDFIKRSVVSEEASSQTSIYSVAFHPTQDIICFGDMVGRILFYDIEKKTPLHTLYELGTRISDVKFSPNGTLAAASNLATGEINVYDAVTYATLKTIKAHPQGIYFLAFSPDSSVIASGSRDNKIGITPIENQWPSQILGEHSFFILSLDFSKDNNFLASGGADGKVIVWEKKGNEINKAPYFAWLHGDWVTSVRFFQDYLLTGSKDGKIRIFDFKKKKLLGDFKVAANIFSLDITPEGEYLFVATNTGIDMYDFKNLTGRLSATRER